MATRPSPQPAKHSASPRRQHLPKPANSCPPLCLVSLGSAACIFIRSAVGKHSVHWCVNVSSLNLFSLGSISPRESPNERLPKGDPGDKDWRPFDLVSWLLFSWIPAGCRPKSWRRLIQNFFYVGITRNYRTAVRRRTIAHSASGSMSRSLSFFLFSL